MKTCISEIDHKSTAYSNISICQNKNIWYLEDILWKSE